MITHNEADRYLQSCIKELQRYASYIYVVDDQSTDNTTEILRDLEVDYEIRPKTVPSFVEAEGLFRQYAWDKLVERAYPWERDWILSIDADEFPIGDLISTIETLEKFDASAANLKIHEIWSTDPIMKRVDGFWDTIKGVRLCRYQHGDQSFRSEGMGCGSVPRYGYQRALDNQFSFQLMHFGYADIKDQELKYEFYSTKLDNGHNNQHIESIRKHGELICMPGHMPEVWRGIK